MLVTVKRPHFAQLLLLPASGFLPDDGGARLESLKTKVTVFSFLRPDVTGLAYRAAIDEHLELLLAATFSNRAISKSRGGKGAALYSGGHQHTLNDLRAFVANLHCYCLFWIAPKKGPVPALMEFFGELPGRPFATEHHPDDHNVVTQSSASYSRAGHGAPGCIPPFRCCWPDIRHPWP
jgi:hypothetical protein